jgi:hypothetical protein
MAKKKDIKPLFAVKHDFVDSLDNMLNEAMFLIQQVDSALKLGAVTNEGVANMLRDRLTSFRAALETTDQVDD